MTAQDRESNPASTFTRAADPDRRAAIIAAGRELLDWLEAHPDVPLCDLNPVSVTFIVGGYGEKDDEKGFEDVRSIAESCGVEPKITSERGRVGVFFGGSNPTFALAEYQALYHSAETMARHNAASSYSGVVEPERPVGGDLA